MAHAAGDWTEFRRDIQKYALKKGDKSKETHLLLDGGRLVVPDEDNAKFLARYAKALFEMEWTYVVERKTLPTFYMMAEWDIKMAGDRVLSPEEIAALVKLVQTRVMTPAYPDHPDAVRVAVLTAPPKKVQLDDGSDATQSGVHLIWRVVVDVPTTWVLRAWMLREIDAANIIPVATRWSEAFDSAIYEENGLRMTGARKAAPCPECKGKSFRRGKEDQGEWGEVCTVCRNAGKIDLGRPYTLEYVADGSGTPIPGRTEVLKKDELELVRATTIRVIPTLPEAWPVAFPTEELRLRLVQAHTTDRAEARAAKRRKKTAAVAEIPADKKRSETDELKDVVFSDPIYDATAQYLTAEFPGAPVLKHLKRGKSGDFLIANTTCHECANKGGSHGSSTVYYILKPTGCVQKCFCKKDQIQPVGLVPCSRYTSQPHKIPHVVQDVIFTGAAIRRRHKEEARVALGASVSAASSEWFDEEPPVQQEPSTAAAAAARFSISNQTPTFYVDRSKKRSRAPRYSPAQFLEATRHATYKIL
jgi:hypothetical protein